MKKLYIVLIFNSLIFSSEAEKKEKKCAVNDRICVLESRIRKLEKRITELEGCCGRQN